MEYTANNYQQDTPPSFDHAAYIEDHSDDAAHTRENNGDLASEFVAPGAEEESKENSRGVERDTVQHDVEGRRRLDEIFNRGVIAYLLAYRLVRERHDVHTRRLDNVGPDGGIEQRLTNFVKKEDQLQGASGAARTRRNTEELLHSVC